MEVVYTKLKGIEDNDYLYTQNDSNVDSCDFENRKQDYQNKNNKLLNNNNNAQIKTFEDSYRYSFIDDTENMDIPEDNLLVNTNNTIIDNTSLIKPSKKYSEDDNINKKFFIKQEGEGEEHLLSATQIDTYKNPQFWTKKFPQIQNNGDYYHNIADTHIHFQNRNIEGYSQDFRIDNDIDYNGITYYGQPYGNISEREIYEEPTVSVNYRTNYSKQNNKITHSGIANSNKQKYTKQNDIYNKNVKNFGQIKYYNEGYLTSFNKEFNLDQKNYNINDPNNNNYDKYVCSEKNLEVPKIRKCDKSVAYSNIENFTYSKVEKGDNIIIENEKENNEYKKIKKCEKYKKNKININNCKVDARTPHEKNIMLKRNENMIASLNNKENQYRRK